MVWLHPAAREAMEDEIAEMMTDGQLAKAVGEIVDELCSPRCDFEARLGAVAFVAKWVAAGRITIH